MLSSSCRWLAPMLRQTLETLAIPTCGEGFTDLTAQLNACIAAHQQALVPEEGTWPVGGLGGLRPDGQADQGPDDRPAHIRTALTSTQLSLLFQAGPLLLVTWQAVYLWKHRRRGSVRQLSVHRLGR